MANSVSNVVAGSTGGVLIAPLGTALPTAASTPLNASFKAAGYIGDDGVQETIGRSTDPVNAWGGDLVKVLQSSFEVSYQFTFIESLNSDVLKAVFGDSNVTSTPASSTSGTLQAIAVNSATLPHKEFVFEIRDGAAKIRVVLPNGQVTEVGDVTYSDSGVVGYQVTVTAFADASGNQAYHYTDDGVLSA
jgi:hypothetical protein